MLQVDTGCRPGAIGRIVALHAAYYCRLVSFGLPFETLVARETCDFCKRYDARTDALWLTMDGDVIEAAITIDGADALGLGAHLRTWYPVGCGRQ